ncbi:hypothetical protein M8J77_003903 [Diaphorina citri]|nr:hypothetical protein M8J77_003903 [Diaphorina citri]
MVRFKNRYVTIQINPEDENLCNQLVDIKSHHVYQAIRYTIKAVHGDFGLACIQNIIAGYLFLRPSRVPSACSHITSDIITSVPGSVVCLPFKRTELVKYLNPKTRIAFIRVPFGPHKLLTSVLPLIKKVDKLPVKLSILYVSATISQCFKFVRDYQRRHLEELWSLLPPGEREQEAPNINHRIRLYIFGLPNLFAHIPSGNSCNMANTSAAGGDSPKAKDVPLQYHHVTREKRRKLWNNKSQGCTVWFTGLSGAGKTSISFQIESYLIAQGIPAYALDGDNLRNGINANLAFSEEDRNENVRRAAECAKMFAECGFIALCSFVSPTAAARDRAREIHRNANLEFFEVFVNTPVEICEQRDVKGHYKKAREGKIKSFTGVSQPYEAPKNPDLILETVNVPVEKCANSVLDMIAAKGLIPARQANVATPLTINNNIIDDGNTVQNDIIEEQYVSHNNAYVEALPRLDIGVIDLQWVQVIAEGWSSPLKGFMREDEFLKTIHFNTLDSNVNQSVAIVLAVTGEDKQRLEGNKEIALYHNSTPVAILYSPEFYVHRKEERIARQFGTTHPGHPYIKHINASGDWLVGGEVKALRKILWSDGLDDYRLSPNQLRAKFRELGADAVFAFQLRNPIHNGHALLMQDTRKKLEAKGYKNPVLLLHPLGGWTKDDDVPLPVRMRQHQAVLAAGVLDAASTVLAIFPSPMMYAGPTEVQWHAKARRNAGANFYIVGRDPAGVPHPDPTPSRDLYDPTHGARVLSVAPGLSSLTILPFKVAAYNTPSQGARVLSVAPGLSSLTILPFKVAAYNTENSRLRRYNFNLYDPTHAARVLSVAPGLSSLTILPFKVAAYNTKNSRLRRYNFNLYDPTHAARVLSVAPGLSSLTILPFKVAAYNTENSRLRRYNFNLYDPTHGARVLSVAPGLSSLTILPFKVAAYNTKNSRLRRYNINLYEPTHAARVLSVAPGLSSLTILPFKVAAYNTPTHGARVLSVAPGLSSLTILPFKVAAYNTVNARMEFFDPARASEFAFISGTKMRNYARSGETPPPGFMAPDAWNILAEFYNPTK